MLHEGRLTSEADRTQAYENMRNASARIAALGDETARLAEWLNPADRRPALVNARQLIERAVISAAVSPPVEMAFDSRVDAVRVNVLDREALETAVGTAVRAVARESGGSPTAMRVSVRGDSTPALELLIGPSALLPALEQAQRQHAPGSFPLTRGGLGLSLVTAVAVLTAHAAQVWTIAGERSTAGIRLPVAAEENS